MDRISDLAFDADGNIVAVGIAQAADYSTRQFAVTRYLPNGQLNQNFNGNGKLVYGSPGFNYNTLGGVAIDSLGRITAAGYREITSQTIRHFAVLRLNPNGTFDNTFGGTGIVFTSITDKDRGTSIVIQPDGRMVVAGSGNSSRLIVLARYLP
jgi:uncharacterized delta-60 repeat protein